MEAQRANFYYEANYLFLLLADGRTEERTDRCADGQIYGRTEVRNNRYTDGRCTDGQKYGGAVASRPIDNSLRASTTIVLVEVGVSSWRSLARTQALSPIILTLSTDTWGGGGCVGVL